MNSPTVMEGTEGDGDDDENGHEDGDDDDDGTFDIENGDEDENGHEDGSNDDGNYDDGEVDDDENGDHARSLKFTHTAHMCGGPKQVGGTKRLVDLKTY